MTKPPVVVHIKSAKTITTELARARLESKTKTPAPEHSKPRSDPIADARHHLSGRLVEKAGSGFWLDGRPVSLDQVMQAVNRVLNAKGLDQIAHSEKWRI